MVYSTYKLHKSKCGGFTLIEVLIVISVILILAAIMFPIMRGARRSALATQDIVHLKQTYLALQLYRESHDDFYPASLLDIVPNYAPEQILTSPADQRPPGSDGRYPADRFADFPNESTLRADFRLSYAYLRPFKNRFPYPQAWEEYISKPTWGIIACGDYLELEDKATVPHPTEHGTQTDSGTWLRIQMDGSLKKAKKAHFGISVGGAYEEIFYYN